MRVFVCSPYSGDIEKNTLLAKKLCRAVVLAGHAPFAPHLFYPQFLNEESETERNLGIGCGIEWPKKCEEIWIFADSFAACSRGMRSEIELAGQLRITRVWNPAEWRKFEVAV